MRRHHNIIASTLTQKGVSLAHIERQVRILSHLRQPCILSLFFLWYVLEPIALNQDVSGSTLEHTVGEDSLNDAVRHELSVVTVPVPCFDNSVIVFTP